MSEFKLESTSTLDGFEQQYDGVVLKELTEVGINSAAIPTDGKKQVEKALETHLQVGMPMVGKSIVSDDRMTRVLRPGNDQLFILFSGNQRESSSLSAEKLGDVAYLTDQTDSWVSLKISGPNSRLALERICMLDLHPDVFGEGDIARTLMEHLGVLLIRESVDGYILMSASSSAKSFLHIVTTSIRNIS